MNVDPDKLDNTISTVIVMLESVRTWGQDVSTPSSSSSDVALDVPSDLGSTKQDHLDDSALVNEKIIQPVIERVFDNEDGLVNWIQNEQDRECAGSYLANLKQNVIDKNGNAVRSQFERLLPIYMRALGMSNITRGLHQQIRELHEYLKPIDQSKDRIQVDGFDRGQINWGCSGIRKVGNHRSHNSGCLSFDEQLAICASISSLGRSLMQVAQTLGFAHSHQLAIADESTPDQSTSPTPSPSSSRLTWNEPVDESPNRAWVNEVTSNPANAWISSHAKNTCEDSLARSRSTLSPPFNFFYTRISEIPEWSTKVKKMYYQMTDRMTLFPRATLCQFTSKEVCQIPNCAQSHTYLEVMQYNPLFKLLTCGIIHHYCLPNVKEYEQCPCAHVNFKILDLMVIMSKKEELCERRQKCHDGGCKKSHSIDEVCWYIPGYKTKECRYVERCTKKSCTYYHYASGINQDKRTGTEHIENPDKIPLVERTHQRLANALEDLRRQGNPPSYGL